MILLRMKTFTWVSTEWFLVIPVFILPMWIASKQGSILRLVTWKNNPSPRTHRIRIFLSTQPAGSMG